MASTWINNYLQASFRGVQFNIENSQYEFGRRTAIHEFPDVDEPYAEDLGRKARVFSLDCYIVGDDYFNARNALINAIETKGSGALVHPYLGTKQVVVTGSTMTESTSEGRVARFSLTFQEQIESKLTASVLNTTVDNIDKVKSLYQSLLDAFIIAYNISQVPVGILQNLLSSIDSALVLLSTAKQTVNSVADFQRELSNIRGKGIQIVLDSQDLANSFQSVISFGTDATSDTNQLTPINARKQFFESLAVSSTQKEKYVQIDYSNPNSVMNMLFYYQSVTAAASTLSIIEYDSREDAESMYNTINAELDFIENTIGMSDDVIASVRDMRFALANDISIRTANLGEIYDYQIGDQSRTTLAISNSIYGTVDKEQDVIARNKIQNPFFASGKLSVVING